MKGQYFSFDAIVASIIFMLAMSILLGQWFNVRQATDMTNEYMQEDAFRVSDLLLSSGVPHDWYSPAKLPTLGGVRKVGIGVSPTQSVVLNDTILDAIGQNLFLYGYAIPPAASNPTPYYNAFRSMLGVGSHFFIRVNSTEKVDSWGWIQPKKSRSIGLPDYGWQTGNNARELVRARRIISFKDENGRLVAGTMDVVVYSKAS